MNLSELCIRRPVMVVLLSISLILVGILAYRSIPVAALPSSTGRATVRRMACAPL